MDIEESFVPQEIKDKIEMLNKMIGEAESLNKEITEWYHANSASSDHRFR